MARDATPFDPNKARTASQYKPSGAQPAATRAMDVAPPTPVGATPTNQIDLEDDGSGMKLGPAKMGAGKAFGTGVSDSATLGFDDELGGAIASLPTALGGVSEGVKVNTAPEPGDSPKVAELKRLIAASQGKVKSSRELVRDSIRDQKKKAAEDQPGANFAGQVFGGVASAAIPIAGTAKAGATLAQIGTRAATQGAAFGAAYGLGSSDADLSNGEYGKAAVDTAGGAALGGMGGVVFGPASQMTGELAGPALSRAAGGLTEYARRMGLRSLGFGRGDLVKLPDGAAPRIADDMAPIIKPMSNPESLRPAIKAMSREQGGRVGDLLAEADAKSGGAGINPAPIAEELKGLLPKFDVMGHDSHYSKFKGLIDDFESRAKGGMSIADANANKSALQDLVSNFQDVPAAQKVMKEAQGALRRGIDDQASNLLGPEKAAEFMDAKQKFGSAKASLKANTKGIANDNARAMNREHTVPNLLGLTNWVGDLVTSRAPSALHAAGRGAARQVDRVRTILASNPEYYGKFGGMLLAANANGNLSEVTSFLQESNPEFAAKQREAAKHAEESGNASQDIE